MKATLVYLKISIQPTLFIRLNRPNINRLISKIYLIQLESGKLLIQGIFLIFIIFYKINYSNITILVCIFSIPYIHFCLQMDEEDDLEEMWLLQDFASQKSKDYAFWSRKDNQSIEEVIDQYFQNEQVLSSKAESIKTQTPCLPSSKTSGEARILRQRKPINRNSINFFKPTEKRSRSRRTIKPSPYHNYQKHLITAIKHIIKLPQTSSCPSNIAKIQHMLWKNFCSNEHETKKVLYFVFNQHNQYEIDRKQLRQYGFEEIYLASSNDQILHAKSLMTRLALEQLTADSINHYLMTRRIKDQQKFKRYMHMFLEELEDGFIKKRFSNKHKTHHDVGNLELLIR